jgi:two-component system nitrate/nitrite response regulator NarL
MGDDIASPEIVTPIRVLVADRTRMNSQLLADALIRDKTFRVIESGPSEAAILAAASGESPDVVLLSSVLEDGPTLGFQVARHLRAAHPKIRTVMLLDASGPDTVVEAFRAGAWGVFSRTESLNHLAKCIYAAHAGQVWANSRELGYLLDALSGALPVRWADGDGFPLLSKREQDVVRCVADGLSNREIARRLNLTEHTVKNYLFRVFDKLEVSSRVEVVLYAFRLAQSQSSSNPAMQASEEEAGNVVATPRTANDRKPSARQSRRQDASRKPRK